MVLFWKKRYKLLLITLLVFSVVVLLLKHNGILGSSPRIPEILFICERYDLDGLCEISFIDKYGQCYFSNDKKVCQEVREYYDFSQDLVYAYRAGRIKLCDSIGKNEVMKQYRKMYKIAEKGDISKNYLYSASMFRSYIEGEPDPEIWVWKWLYRDLSGAIQYVTLHEREETTHAILSGQEEIEDTYITTKNKRVNQIYEWCRDRMDEMDLGYGSQ